MAVKLANMAASRLAANIGPADLSIQLRAGDGDRFPVLTGADDWFPLALVNDLAQTEFLRCTARVGDTLTVRRGREGSVARAYSVGDVVELRLTLEALTALRDQEEAP